MILTHSSSSYSAFYRLFLLLKWITSKSNFKLIKKKQIVGLLMGDEMKMDITFQRKMYIKLVIKSNYYFLLTEMSS